MSGCYDCGARYGSWPDYYADPVLWASYSPTGDDGGLLCLNCFAQRLADRADHAHATGVTGVRVDPVLGVKITGSGHA